jgi:hypothetical protein
MYFKLRLENRSFINLQELIQFFGELVQVGGTALHSDSGG